ncbi:protein Red [Naviculisporaceae sp. PSN 640]
MNNEQFRRLVAANSAKSAAEKNGSVSPPAAAPSNGGGGGRPAALGSRLKSSIPMTPRSVAGTSSNNRVDFARQLAERNRAFEKSLEKNKKKTSAPKGTKFAAGYVDRAKTRQEQQDEQDEREARVKALEESLKKGEIDQATHDKLRLEIAGGDLSSTHLVKGLDFKLLERIRKGEDVTKPKEQSEPKQESPADEEKEQVEEEEDPDAILERLESAEVKAIEREKAEKKGKIATTTLNPGQKRTRAQIIAELKASREAAKAKPKEPESTLGSRFKKIGTKQAPGTRIERDSTGREVMIIVDEDGHERRKVRKIDTKLSEQERREREAEELAKTNGNVLGMEVPEFYKQQLEAERLAQEEKDKEITIFDDVGSDYDPLAGLEGSDSDSDDSKGEDGEDGEVKEKDKENEKKKKDMTPPPPPGESGPRNWFKDSKAPLTSQEEYKAPSLNDPTFLAALKKAKAIAAKEKSEEEQIAAEREARLRKKLAESNRDDDDMDFGFGSSRVEDEADLRDDKVKVSEWRDRRGGEDGGDDDYDDDGEDGGGGGGGKGKRKRGGKKKKGDKNNFADVMKVIEQKKKSS